MVQASTRARCGRSRLPSSKMVGGPLSMSLRRPVRQLATLFCAVALFLWVNPATAVPEGTLTLALHFSPVTRWLDPAEGESTITPYLLLYAIHDGLLKPMPGQGSAPSLAESWSMAKD